MHNLKNDKNDSAPSLLIMAAGMGSRYGGLKQLDPVGPNRQLIIDYSVYDALRAGFEDIVFIIKKETEKEFRETIGNRINEKANVKYVFQDTEDLPQGFSVPAGRTKPWGTAHAVYSARNAVSGPFAVINADDYYGRSAFEGVFKSLEKMQLNASVPEYILVSYLLKNTVTAHGSVARGACEVGADGYLERIVEKTNIVQVGKEIFSIDGEGKRETLDENLPVSMNLWAFDCSFIDETKKRFSKFFENAVAENPLKSEFFLPSVVDELIKENVVRVKVTPCFDKWYGMTYSEDKDKVIKAIDEMIKEKVYPGKLW